MNLKTHFVFIALALFLFNSCEENKFEQIPPGTQKIHEFQYTNNEGKVKHAKFILSVPLNYNFEKKHPLLVALNGDSLTAEGLHKIWKPATDSLGVILFTPISEETDSSGVLWNENSDIMILTGMDEAAAKINLNFDEIYVAGFYNGGTLAYEFGFKYPRIFKGVSAISSRLPGYYKTESLEFLKRNKFYITAGEFETDIKDDANEALKLMIKNSILTQHIIYFDVYKGLPEAFHIEIKKIVEYFFVKDEKQK